MRNRFLINANCFILLFAISAFSKLSLPSIADDAFSKELIGQCAAVMSAPIRFKVILIRHAHSKGYEHVVSVAEESMQRVTRIEQGLGSLTPTVTVIGDSRCFDFYPKQNTVIDKTFMLRDVQSVWEEMTDPCRLQGDIVCKEDSAEKWLCRETSEKLIVELRIFKSTKFVESKRIFDRNSKELLKEYRYSDFESAIFPASFFSTGSARLLKAENFKDYSTKFIEVFKDGNRAIVSSLKAEAKKMEEYVPYKTDPKTGRQILQPLPGMSNEDFARGIGEAIEKLPTPKGVSKAKVKEVAEKWKANTELKPVDLDPPRKANRGYGSVWLYLGVFLAIGTAVVVGIRFWMAN